MRRRKLSDWVWLGWLLVGALVVLVGYLRLPSNSLPGNIVYDLIGLSSAAAIVIGVRWHRPPRPLLWYLFAGGQALWVVGDVTFGYYTFVLEQEPFPSVADGFYLGAYPILIAALYLLVRGRAGRRDRAGLLDAALVGIALALLTWTILMRPIVDDSSISLGTKLISLAYPAVDVLMLAMTARLLTTTGARAASYRMLVMAVMLLLVSDLTFSALTAFASYDGGLVDLGWLFSYLLWGAAALHPSMRSLSQVTTGPVTRLSTLRLAVLVMSVLLAPALLLVQGTRHPLQIDWLVIGTGAVALCTLSAVRVAGIVSQVHHQASRLETLALQDELTGLDNRRQLEESIRTAITAGDPAQVHVALVDLDDFKAINDRLGHDVGDRLLVAVGERLRTELRKGDSVARLSGDAFALLMPVADDGEVDAVAERILAALRRPLDAGSHQLLVQASIGIGDGANTTEPFELLRRADIAMYAAKEADRGRFLHYGPEMDERAIEHAQLGAELRRALAEDEFELVYQPIVTLGEARLVGVEALVRWHHHTGLIAPLRFIPIAERNGVIVELGQWILRAACTQAAAWRTLLGPAAPATMSVNVSPRQLVEPGFAGSCAAILAETGLPPECLTVEVTETAVFGGGRALDELNALHDLGVQVALDDFGTGHSSLGLLQTCPVDILKVDKSFVDRIANDAGQAVIAAALINISDGLHLTAIAEGVETADQVVNLQRLGYRYGQGYHFGRPMAAHTLTGILLASAARAAEAPRAADPGAADPGAAATGAEAGATAGAERAGATEPEATPAR